MAATIGVRRSSFPAAAAGGADTRAAAAKAQARRKAWRVDFIVSRSIIKSIYRKGILSILNTRQKKAVQALVELVYRAGPDVPSGQLATWLNLSRDSVHQLLLPLVRNGWVAAGRGRNGGYRATPVAPAVTVLAVVSLYSREGREPSPDDPAAPRFIRNLDQRASERYRQFLSSVTVGGLVAEVRAEREEPTYSI
jgi:DNA-binding IscR family transcriptional regulator